MTERLGTKPVIFEARCSKCNRLVASEELYPPAVRRVRRFGEESSERKLDRHWRYVSDGEGEGYNELTAAEFQQLAAKITGPDAAEFVRLRCRECHLIFCWNHVKVTYEGDPEMTVAELPCGHFRVLR